MPRSSPDIAQRQAQARAQASQAQRPAIDPQVSAWVTANAGTGKTKVLTDRLLRLLLSGTPPSKILCLTFTKAAAAETRNRLSDALGILHKDGVALRATFIVDPDGIIRWVNVNDLSVGRNVDETLRVLDALQTDELCPCNWEKGEKTLGSAA